MAARSPSLPLIGLLAVLLLIGAALWLLSDDSGGAARLDALQPAAAPAEAAPRNPEALDPRHGAATPTSQPAQLESREPARADVTQLAQPLSGSLRRLADGAPLAGWSVRVPFTDTDGRLTLSAPVGAKTVTDEQGRFAFAAVPTHFTHLTLTRVGLPVGRELRVELTPDAFGRDRENKWTVDTGWVLEGRVRSAVGRPLLDAGVLGSDASWIVPEPDGSFRLEDVGPRGLLPGPYTLTLGAALHERVAFDLYLDDATRYISGLDVELEAAGALEGRVLGADGYAHPFDRVSLPLRITERTVVRAEPMPTSDSFQPVSTAPGRSRVPGDPVEDASVAASQELQHYRVDSIPPGRYVVRVELPKSEAGITEALLRQAESLRDAVAPITPDGSLQVMPSVSARLPWPRDDGDTQLLHASADHWEQEVVIVAGEVTRLDVQLAWGAVLQGSVSDSLGAPLADAQVEVLREITWEFAERGGYLVAPNDDYELRQQPNEDREGSQARLSITAGQATTDAGGGFAIGRLPPGDYLVRVRAPASESLRDVERVVRFVAAEVTREDFVLDRGLAIRGRLLDEQGVPLTDARVAAKRPSNTVILTGEDFVGTNERGEFVIGGLEPGEWVLHPAAPGFLGGSHPAEAGAAPLDIVLQRARALRLRVLNARDDTPISEYSLTLSTDRTYSQTTVQSDDGHYVADGLRAEPLSVRVSATGFQDTTLDDLLPEPGPEEQLTEIVLRLPPNS